MGKELETRKMTREDFELQLKSNKKRVLVAFKTDWSGGSYLLHLLLKKVAINYHKRINIFKVDADTNQGLADSYHVRNLPTLLFFHRGKVVDVLEGIKPISIINRHIDQFLK